MVKHTVRLMTVIMLIAVVLLSVNPELAVLGYHMPVIVHIIHHFPQKEMLTVHINIQIIIEHIRHHLIHIEHIHHLAILRGRK